MPLSSSLALTVGASLTGTLDLGTLTAGTSVSYRTTLTSGTGAGAADKIFQDTRTLTASATENLDLSGVLLDAFGAAILFARVKALIFSAAAANTNNVLVGGTVANNFFAVFGAADDLLILRPGATLALIAGVADATCYPVTAGTADLVKVTNSAGTTSVTYDVVVIGSSA